MCVWVGEAGGMCVCVGGWVGETGGMCVFVRGGRRVGGV